MCFDKWLIQDGDENQCMMIFVDRSRIADGMIVGSCVERIIRMPSCLCNRMARRIPSVSGEECS